MGIDISQLMAVGYKIEHKQLVKRFSKIIPAKYRYEDRYDSKTGTKIAPAKITIEDEVIEYIYNGEKYADVDKIVRNLAQKLNCDWKKVGDWMNGDFHYLLGYHFTKICDAGRCPEDTMLPLDDIVENYLNKYKALGVGLKALGLDPGQLGIFSCYNIG